METTTNIKALLIICMLFASGYGHGQNSVSFEYKIHRTDLPDIFFPCPSNICDSLRVTDIYDSTKYKTTQDGKDLHIFFNSIPSFEYTRNGSCFLNTLRKKYEKNIFTHTLFLMQHPDTIYVHSNNWDFVFKKGDSYCYKMIDYTKNSDSSVDSIRVLYYFDGDSVVRVDNYQSRTTYLYHNTANSQYGNNCTIIEWKDGECNYKFSLGHERIEKRMIFAFIGMHPTDNMKVEDDYNNCIKSCVQHKEMIIFHQ